MKSLMPTIFLSRYFLRAKFFIFNLNSFLTTIFQNTHLNFFISHWSFQHYLQSYFNYWRTPETIISCILIEKKILKVLPLSSSKTIQMPTKNLPPNWFLKKWLSITPVFFYPGTYPLLKASSSNPSSHRPCFSSLFQDFSLTCFGQVLMMGFLGPPLT